MTEQNKKVLKILLLILFVGIIAFIIYFFLPKKFSRCSNLPKGENYCDFYECNKGIPYAIGVAPKGYADYMECWGGEVLDSYENAID